jgi:ribonuclease HI
MTPAGPLLDHRQRKYALRALKLPLNNLANQLLPQTLKFGDGNAQSEVYLEEDLAWIYPKIKPKNLAQRLAKNLIKELNLDPLKGFEEAQIVRKRIFSGEVIISKKEIAISNAEKPQKGLILWTDGSKSELGFSGIGITGNIRSKYIQKSISLKEAKESFDAELFGILEALKLARKEREKESYKFLTIFSDSQTVISRILNDELGPGQSLAIEIIEIAQKLNEKNVKIFIRWISSHMKIIDNEKADFLAKKAIKNSKNAQIDGYSSFSCVNRLVKNFKSENTRNWLLKKQEKRQNQLN